MIYYELSISVELFGNVQQSNTFACSGQREATLIRVVPDVTILPDFIIAAEFARPWPVPLIPYQEGCPDSGPGPSGWTLVEN